MIILIYQLIKIGWRPSEYRSEEEVGNEADETEKESREAFQ